MAGESWQHDRRSRQARGYGKEWDRIRPVILKRDGYRCQCDDCKRSGVLKPATEVDHKISKANWKRRFGNLDSVDLPANLQAINSDCHKKKSLAERGYREQAVIGDDGFPVEHQR